VWYQVSWGRQEDKNEEKQNKVKLSSAMFGCMAVIS
jgi:hypothetical protein